MICEFDQYFDAVGSGVVSDCGCEVKQNLASDKLRDTVRINTNHNGSVTACSSSLGR